MSAHAMPRSSHRPRRSNTMKLPAMAHLLLGKDLGNEDAARLLESTLEEEKSADKKLSSWRKPPSISGQQPDSKEGEANASPSHFITFSALNSQRLRRDCELPCMFGSIAPMSTPMPRPNSREHQWLLIRERLDRTLTGDFRHCACHASRAGCTSGLAGPVVAPLTAFLMRKSCPPFPELRLELPRLEDLVGRLRLLAL